MSLFSRTKKRTTPSRGSVGINREFAFLDVETTGLDPRKDRVIEVGIVITDGGGRTIDEWSTLVNPGVGVQAGPTQIHGIESQWLAASPSFDTVMHEIAARISGRFLVGHNCRFDCDFLEAEFLRSGHEFAGDWSTICTMDLADKFGLPRRLPMTCASVGIPHETHDALGDARACAQLFKMFLRRIDPATFAGIPGSTMGTVPTVGPPVAPVFRHEAKTATRVRPVLRDLVDSLPAYVSTADRDPAASRTYLTVLENAVADGYISPDEVQGLVEVANQHQLTGEEVRDLHRELILGLIDVALDDRRISGAEREEIERVASWLDVGLTDWDAMVKASRQRIKARIEQFRKEVAGKSIAFTGAGVHTPNIREAFAAKLAFDYATRVSERTDLLIIGTAATDTGQVEKAHELGLPIMIESTFWRLLGEL